MKNDLEIYNNRGEYAAPVALTYIILGCISTPFTFIILNSTYKLFKHKMSADLKISLCVLLADFIASIAAIILGLMARFNGLYIVHNKWYCSMTILIYANVNYLSIFYVGLMSLERGILIIHNLKLPDNLWLALLMGEFIFLITITSIAINWNQIGLIRLAFACMVTPNFKIGVILTWTLFFLLAFNFICVFYCYIGIAIKIRLNAWKSIRELNLNKETTLRQANRTTVKVISLLIIYILCNGLELYNFAKEIVTGVTRPGFSHYISTNLLVLGPIVNSIIMVHFYDPVRVALCEILPFLKYIFKNDPDTSLNETLFNSNNNNNNNNVVSRNTNPIVAL